MVRTISKSLFQHPISATVLKPDSFTPDECNRRGTGINDWWLPFEPSPLAYAMNRCFTHLFYSDASLHITAAAIDHSNHSDGHKSLDLISVWLSNCEWTEKEMWDWLTPQCFTVFILVHKPRKSDNADRSKQSKAVFGQSGSTLELVFSLHCQCNSQFSSSFVLPLFFLFATTSDLYFSVTWMIMNEYMCLWLTITSQPNRNQAIECDKMASLFLETFLLLTSEDKLEAALISVNTYLSIFEEVGTVWIWNKLFKKTEASVWFAVRCITNFCGIDCE